MATMSQNVAEAELLFPLFEADMRRLDAQEPWVQRMPNEYLELELISADRWYEAQVTLMSYRAPA